MVSVDRDATALTAKPAHGFYMGPALDGTALEIANLSEWCWPNRHVARPELCWLEDSRDQRISHLESWNLTHAEMFESSKKQCYL